MNQRTSLAALAVVLSALSLLNGCSKDEETKVAAAAPPPVNVMSTP